MKTENKSPFVPLEGLVSEVQLIYNPIVRVENRIQVNNSADASKLFRKFWNPNTIELRESFKVMLLNRALHVMGIVTISKGGFTATLVDIRFLFSVVLKSTATTIVLAHNHPSGSLQPSEEDFTLTRIIVDGAKLFDILVMDHIILTRDHYYSMRSGPVCKELFDWKIKNHHS